MVATNAQDSKYAVANILTSMASSRQVPALSSAGATGTDLLTPNTLRTIEKTLGEMQDSSDEAMNVTFVTMPASNWDEPAVKVARASPNLNNEGYEMAPSGFEDDERRRMRRERNKVAAAKCRKRRVDLTNYLQNETDKLEVDKNRLEEEIVELQREKDQLEFVMQAHRPVCRMLKIPQADRPMNLKVEDAPAESVPVILPPKKIPSRPSNLPVNNFEKQPGAPVPRRRIDSDLNTPVVSDRLALILPPKKSPIRARKFLEDLHSEELHTPVAGMITPQPSARPASLFLRTHSLKLEPLELDTPKGGEGATGVPISTPSNEMPQLGLETGTGLTPLMSEFRSVVPPTEDHRDLQRHHSDSLVPL